jgi:AbrB family looped-hinge helix DNA binding protein
VPSAAITGKNQLTLPVQIREILQVHPGDRVLFRVAEDGRVTVEAETLPVSALKGLLTSPLGRPLSLEEMDDAIAAGAAASLGGNDARG